MGQSRQLSVGPDAVVSIMTALVVASTPDGVDPLQYVQLLSFFIGVFVFILGILRLGFLDVILSRPLLGGFINAVAMEIIIEQSDALLGIANRQIHGWRKFPYIFENWDKIKPLTVMIIIFFVFFFSNQIC
jgi:MFS superfamily sulfate permease-like transporter